MQEMVQFVYDFYQSKLKTWQNSKTQNDKTSKEERLKRLNEEERVIREKLNQAIERSEKKARLNIGKSFEEYGSSSSSSEDEDQIETNNNNQDLTGDDLNEKMNSDNVQIKEDQ